MLTVTACAYNILEFVLCFVPGYSSTNNDNKKSTVLNLVHVLEYYVAADLSQY
jgi:hypothetical protein